VTRPNNSSVPLLVACTLGLLFSLGSVAHGQVVPPRIQNIQIGFDGAYKLGTWAPVRVEILGGSQPLAGRLSITVPDSDGVPTTVATPADRPLSIEPGAITTARLFIRVGQIDSSFGVRLTAADGRVITERSFYAGMPQVTIELSDGLPATSRLVVEFGPPVGFSDLVSRQERDHLGETRIARVDDPVELPTEWYGYEGVDLMVLTTSQPALYRSLQQSPARLEALQRWVKLGGKLVLFCGAEAEELLAGDGPLAAFVPGTYEETVTLGQSQPLETFSGSDQPVTPDRRVDLRIPRLSSVRGNILLSGGGRLTDLPLVVRSYLGFGELTFVGLDFDRPPLRDWGGRTEFLRKATAWEELPAAQQTTPGMGFRVYDDLVGLVRNALDDSFAGVSPVPFAIVALLVVVYILLIGPGDYYLVTKILKRPQATWVSFPLMVVAVSVAAYFFANWMKGDQLRVNQVEIVDVLAEDGLTRGTAWTHFFTPQVQKFDFTFQPDAFGTTSLAGNQTESLADTQEVVSWLGLPGYALGGMQGGGAQTNPFDRGYRFGDALDSMIDLPVQLWSTKTITARWTGTKPTPITVDLRQTGDELLTGEFVNNLGVPLQDCLLLYGRWAFHFGSVDVGATRRIEDARQPRTAKTMLTSATAGDTTITTTAEDGTVPFSLAQNDVTRLVKVMMFFRAIDGNRYTSMQSEYQSFLDMSHLLEQESVAVLLARTSAPGSHWESSQQPFRSDEDQTWTYYRIVLPVKPMDDEER